MSISKLTILLSFGVLACPSAAADEHHQAYILPHDCWIIAEPSQYNSVDDTYGAVFIEISSEDDWEAMTREGSPGACADPVSWDDWRLVVVHLRGDYSEVTSVNEHSEALEIEMAAIWKCGGTPTSGATSLMMLVAAGDLPLSFILTNRDVCSDLCKEDQKCTYPP